MKPLLILIFSLASAQARVLTILIEHTQPQGAYERITGHISGELDPKNPLNAIITDIQLAPRNARGLVEYNATFTLLKPADIVPPSFANDTAPGPLILVHPWVRMDGGLGKPSSLIVPLSIALAGKIIV